MGNHYLTDVDHGSHCLARHRTASLTYMSDKTCEGAQFQGYMWECMRLQETQRVWTGTNLLRRSGDPSEDALYSSVTVTKGFFFKKKSKKVKNGLREFWDTLVPKNWIKVHMLEPPTYNVTYGDPPPIYVVIVRVSRDLYMYMCALLLVESSF